MKNFLYCMFIMTLLSIDSNAQPGNSISELRKSDLWTDLGEILEPVIVRETYDTRNGTNNYGNENNDIYFSFSIYRPTLIVSHFNGSSLEDVEAHLLYFPLSEPMDNLVDVGDPVTSGNYVEKMEEKIKLLPYLNLHLEENIGHGVIGSLFVQILQPGYYIFQCEGASTFGNDYNGEITSNIYINPLGTSMEAPMEIGDFSDDFNYHFSVLFDFDDSQELFFSVRLNYPMEINLSPEQTVESFHSIEIMEKSGAILATSDGSQLIKKAMLDAGDYVIRSFIKAKRNIQLNISGSTDILKGDKKEKPIDIDSVILPLDFQDTFNTEFFTDFYHGNTTSDVYYRLKINSPMDILVSVPSSTVEGGVNVYLLNEADFLKGTLDTNNDKNLYVSNLSAGTYYIVAEGSKNNGEIALRVQGYEHFDNVRSRDKNYVATRTYTQETGIRWQNKTDYYDGLGRLEQSVLKYSQSKNDIVAYQEYDAQGRSSKQWLPTAFQDNGGKFILPDVVKSKVIATYGDNVPYSRPVYEASPLNRILEQYGPGQGWQDNHHSVKNTYLTNMTGTDTLNCIHFTATNVSDTVMRISRIGNYATGQLYVTRVEDEDGNPSFEFKDKLNQLVLTRQIIQTGRNKELYDTYYIYDDFGNRVAVLPPAASSMFGSGSSTSWMSNTDATLLQYAFLYKYNSRKLQIAKKLPGCSWSFYIYDKGKRLIFSQDGKQHSRGEWSFSIPDMFGRECFSGICRNALNPFADPLLSSVVGASWYSGSSSAGGSGSYKGYSLSGITLTSSSLLSVKYYDDYSFLGRNGFPVSTDAGVCYDVNAESEGFGKRHSASSRDMLTGNMIACLDEKGQSYLYTVMYYDDHDRVIQRKSNNRLNGGVEKDYIAYNFIGQPTKHKHIHSAAGKATQSEVYSYSYDYADRLQTTTHCLNNGPVMTLVNNEYDELGRLKHNRRNGQSNLHTNYAYNLRSWTESISSPLFCETLYYNDTRSNPTNTRYYNGNISGMDWSVNGDKKRGYDFSYDNLSRLLYADYLENNIRNHNFNTSYNYDKQGNIVSLMRSGNQNTTYGIIDNLTLNYRGNQLIKVEDTASDSNLSVSSMDFRNGAKQDVEYFYDENGNLIKDLNKGIADIQYNLLNLPRRITFNDTNKSTHEYVYSADGKKLSVIHKSSAENRTDYIGNMIYENGSLKRILVDGGYIENGIYYFYLQDHLGNNRVVAKSDGTVTQTNHYYPFGMSFTESTHGDKQPYKYNNKELDMNNGLNRYDYGARMYDPALGRWHVVDPMAEKYYWESPYGYCGNNSINWIDPDGQMKVIYNPDRTYKETTHNNWFHNTFIGRKEYIDYGDQKVNLSESEFWQWQITGKYDNVGSVSSLISNLELTLNEPPTGLIDGAAKYAASSVYSLMNSPKVWLTGKSWAGTYATPDERANGFINVATQSFPASRLLKQLQPVSWLKFKYANPHIPTKIKHSVYDMEMRRFDEINRNPNAFKKMNDGIDGFLYINKKRKNDERY